MNTEIPPRYVNEDGKQESVNSYETFYLIYLPSKKNLTAKDIAKLSGFSVTTCQEWMSKNKYKDRKKEILLKQEEQKQEKQKSLLDIVGDTIEQQIKLNTLTDNGFMMKTKNEMQMYSNDNHLQLENLDINSDIYKNLHYAQKEDKLRPLKTIEAIRNFYNLQAEVVEQHEEQAVLQEAMEYAEEARFHNNLHAINQLKEDMEDEEY